MPPLCRAPAPSPDCRSPPTGPEQDAGAALLAVVLLMFVVLALATLVLGVVVSQVKPTRPPSRAHG